MRAPIALSKTKLLSLKQCRRKLWLETYQPELVPEPSALALAGCGALGLGLFAQRRLRRRRERASSTA